MDRIRLIIREAIDDFLEKENQANIDPHKMIFIKDARMARDFNGTIGSVFKKKG